MEQTIATRRRFPLAAIVVAGFLAASALVGALAIVALMRPPAGAATWKPLRYQPRKDIETSGNSVVNANLTPWPPEADLRTVAASWHRAGYRGVETVDRLLAQPALPSDEKINLMLQKAMLYNYEGDSEPAYNVLKELRSFVESSESRAAEWLPTVAFYQGMTALRLGETENCVMCRGASSCIIPIVPEAVHQFPRGSRWAIEHFSEYLRRFPDDLEVRWLLNLAHMTLGEHPNKVDPRFLISLDRFTRAEFDIGRFRDIGHEVGINRLNEAGAGVLEDFDNDGWLDWAVTSDDPNQPMAVYRNDGAGKFVEVSRVAGVLDQLGALNAVQTDYNNDGYMDLLFIAGRG